MDRNIEIKARVENAREFETVMKKAQALADQGPIEIAQDDTFFTCPNGRLKLRTFSDTKGELIFYVRPDQAGPKESSYLIYPTRSPGTLRELLTQAWGQVGRVRKHRTLFLAGRTRIHLDRVEGLGHFVELEVVLSDGEPAEAGIAVARDLMGRLGVAPDQLIEGAYIDLLTS